MQQLLLDIHPAPLPTLANFQPGRNRELLQLLHDLLSGKAKERFIYVWGNPGCGKTHLLQAVVSGYVQQGTKAVYCCARNPCGFTVDHDVHCVTIDDIDGLNASRQIDMFHWYNRLRDESQTVLLISGTVAPMHLTLRQDLVTRLGWGLVYQIHELTETEKMQAMRTYADECGYDLPPEICLYLLRHGQRDLPSLMMLLDALDRYALTHQRQMTIPLLRELLRVT
ncbi:MAG: DnaA regulatory inactivator Hda [Nitrosomonas sp.]|nr:MAG: DnaA regulatory inactivator Hda [Nitrosomonas sp.]